eukprot:TRINITY_DN36575_c0_g1_i1.p1 TRINITY_DN36575_c0_g1~~TRINITY_DN36575_c0_g1_i1.p1  ORF type:complete len:518 (+),score=131.23 TRINITY_DN36575_c0_g1_i1:77-1555(+)
MDPARPRAAAGALLVLVCCCGVAEASGSRSRGRQRPTRASPVTGSPPRSAAPSRTGRATLHPTRVAVPPASPAPAPLPTGQPPAAAKTPSSRIACRNAPPASGDVGGCFVCRQCNSSRDCGEVASAGMQQKDREWRLARSDGLYRPKQLSEEKLCLRKWMVGCPGPTGLEVCNSYTEVCAESDALFDESIRAGKYSVCSEAAFMSPSTVTLVFTIPVCLTAVLGVASATALYHAMHSGLCGCPPSPVRLPVLLGSCTLLVFAVLSFFSPYFGTGIVGAVVGLFALIAHSVVTAVTDDAVLQVRGEIGREPAERAQRWLAAAAASTFAAVYFVWGQGYPTQAGLSDLQLGQMCADFYHFFVVDPRLRGPDHNREVRFWGYCERDYVADTLWNVTAIVWISLMLGAVHLLSLAGITYRHREEERQRSAAADHNAGLVELSAGGRVPFTIDALRSRSTEPAHGGKISNTSFHRHGLPSLSPDRRLAGLMVESYHV